MKTLRQRLFSALRECFDIFDGQASDECYPCSFRITLLKGEIMNLKRITCLLSVILFLATPVLAQMNSTDEIELTRSKIEADRKGLVAEVMEFTDEESKAFWPIYKEYRSDIDKVNDRFIDMLHVFSDNYEDLSGQIATDILTSFLDIEEDKLIYKRVYIDKFLRILSPQKVAKFFQLENKIETVIKIGLAMDVPLITIEDGSN